MAEFTTNTLTQRFAVNDLGRLSKKKKEIGDNITLKRKLIIFNELKRSKKEIRTSPKHELYLGIYLNKKEISTIYFRSNYEVQGHF